MENELLIGVLYRHFKGDLYTTIGLATHSETQEKLVVYRNCSSQNLYVRPLEMFLEKVTRDGLTFDRFSAITFNLSEYSYCLIY